MHGSYNTAYYTGVSVAADETESHLLPSANTVVGFAQRRRDFFTAVQTLPDRSQVSTTVRSYSVSRKKLFLPLRFSANISPTTENFKIKFYTSIVRLYPRKIAKFYSIAGIYNFDEVMPY